MNNKSSKAVIHRMFISLIIVMTLNYLVSTVNGLVDYYCISNFTNQDAVTGFGLFSPLNQIIAGVAGVFAIGGEATITKLLAKGDNKNANKCFSINIIFLLILGLVLFVFSFIFASPLSYLLGSARATDPEIVTKYTRGYIRGFMIGVPFYFIQEFLMTVLYIDGDKKRSVISIAACLITNIVLDVVFAKTMTSNKMFYFGLASSSGFIVGTIILCTHFLSKKNGFKLEFKELKPKFILTNFVAGLPVGIKNVAITLRLHLINLIMLNIGGNIAINARGLESNVSCLFEALLGGLLSATIVLSGVLYSEEDEEGLNTMLYDIFKFSFIVNGVLTIAYFFTAPYIVKIFNPTPEVAEQAVFAMRCTAVVLIIATINTAFLGFFQGTKRAVYANVITVLQSFVLPVVFITSLGFTLGMNGIWFGTSAGFIAYFVIHFTYAFIRKKRIKFDAKTVFFIKDDFGFKDDEKIEFNIDGLHHTTEIVNQILEFGKRLNLDERRKQNLANCCEELAVLIVVSGFTKNLKKKHYASIKVLYKKKDDLLIIRSRDNCEKFDIKERLKKIKDIQDYDSTINMSLRMISTMAKDIDYANILNTNNMIIKF